MATVETKAKNQMLDAIGDGTDGLVGIKLFYDDLTHSSVQTIEWNGASNGEIGIQHFYETLYSFTNSGTFTVRNTRINVG